MADKYDVYCDFDLKKHKETYINYLEVMIDKDGTVHYAVPSHQEYAIQEMCRQKGITRNDVGDLTPPERYGDWLDWLLEETGLVAVWNGYYQGKANSKQKNKLKTLKLAGVYSGRISNEVSYEY